MKHDGDVIIVTSEEVNEHLTEVANDEGLTLEQFFAKGRADELEGNARDQWLMWAPMTDDND